MRKIVKMSQQVREGKMFIIRKILEWFQNYDKKQQSKIPKYLSGKKR